MSKKLVDKLHQLIERNGPLPHPVHKAYAFYREPVHPDAHEDTKAYQRAHFSYRDGYVLTLRCIDNYFGSIIAEEDLEGL